MKIKKGMCWHVWHNRLLSYCPDYDGRVWMIEATKPVHEVKPRLAWMQMVKGKLPEEVVRTCEASNEVCEAYNKVDEAFNKTCEAYKKVDEAYGKTYEACYKAYEAYGKAYEAYGKARKAYDKAMADNKDAIEKLHAEECKACSWNGENLVFKS